MGIFSTLLTVFLALIGAPLFVVIAVGGIVLLYAGDIPLSAVIIELYKLAHTPMLVALPLFSLAGYVLAASGAPQRLVRLSQALLGWLPGGLAVVALIFSAVFTALTGAIGLTIVALGGLLYPALKSRDYPEKFSLGLVTTSGTLGLLFPPSLPLILYGVLSQTNIDQLFKGGLLPGLFMVLFFSAYSLVQGIRSGVSRPAFNWQEVRGAFRESIWEIPLPLVVLGGIYTGLVAISEAAALTVIYVL
ncbi:MAG: TRAP transporter large permease subunit, partial [Desulfobacterota bacterium]|nr:TRAP transporter large permease subunit [Thermodesulfobacteriota bacterium]